MKGNAKIMAIILLLLVLSGCQSSGYRAINTSEYRDVRNNYDVTFGWNLKSVQDGLLLDGFARNNRYFIINELALIVAVVSPDGAEKVRRSLLVHPSEIRLNESAGFSVALPVKLQQGDSLRYIYNYRAVENAEEGFFWMNSFDSPARTE